MGLVAQNPLLTKTATQEKCENLTCYDKYVDCSFPMMTKKDMWSTV